MENIKKILMERDEMDEKEAEELIEETKKEINDCIKCGNIEGAEEIFNDNIGLEIDYLVDFF